MEGKAILAQLGITGDYEGIGHCIIGYPEGEIRLPRSRAKRIMYTGWNKSKAG